MKRVYCISGLGADERVFGKLRIPGVELQCLKWIDPAGRESISAYAKRMCEQLPYKDPVLMGLSFGGMMAIEMAKHLPAKKVILVSSVKSRKELPVWMKFCGNLKLNRMAPARPYKWLSGIENNFLGARGEEERKLANEFRQTVDPFYLKWAIDQVVNWNNDFYPSSLYHLHGTQDRTFPIKYVQPTHTINGGGHFMVMNHADEVSAILAKIIAE